MNAFMSLFKKSKKADHAVNALDYMRANHFRAALWHAQSVTDEVTSNFLQAKIHYIFAVRRGCGLWSPETAKDGWLWGQTDEFPDLRKAQHFIDLVPENSISEQYSLAAQILCYGLSPTQIIEQQAVIHALSVAAEKEGCVFSRAKMMLFHSQKRNFDEVIRYYEMGQPGGETESIMIRLKMMGMNNGADLEKHIHKAMELGHADGFLFHGRKLLKTDMFQAENHLRKAMTMGHPEAGALLADALSRESDAQDRKQSINELYQHSASLGHTGSRVMLDIRTVLGWVPGGDKEIALQSLSGQAARGQEVARKFLRAYGYN